MSKKSNPAIWVGLAVAVIGAIMVFAYAGEGGSPKGKEAKAAEAAAVATTGGLDIPPGTNAVAVNMPVPHGVARYATTGAMVNVYATFKAGAGPDPNPVTKLILSNVKVLSDRASAGKDAPAVAGGTGELVMTLALSAGDSEKLIYAKENGSVWFGLARPGEALATTGGVTPKTAVR